MKTKSENHFDPQVISGLINSGKAVAIETDTVPGILFKTNSKKLEESIFKAKNRSKEKLFQFLSSDPEKAISYFLDDKELQAKIEILIKKFWPGPLTIVAEKNNKISSLEKETEFIGIRVPEEPFLREIIRSCKGMVKATSFNKTGKGAPLNFKETQELEKELKKSGLEISSFFSQDFCLKKEKKASTVIKVLKNKKIEILREGFISKKDLEVF